jgi:tRNA (guanine-N7-)-methyltransferase
VQAGDAVRTFKTRKGRVTTSQADALARLWRTYGVVADGTALDLARLFGRHAPTVLEIGFGRGEATARMAAADPTRNLLAVDVHTPGLGNLLRLVEAGALTNVRVVEGDALVLLRDMLAPGSLDEVRVFFPDPWPKARHAKRRLVSPAFSALVATRLRPGGRLHVATDSPAYAAQALAVLDASAELAVVSQRRGDRPVTRFEQQGLDAGRPAHDVVAVRLPAAGPLPG